MAEIHVNELYEIYQIITDFSNPLEIFREAIQNSFDAEAKDVYISITAALGVNKDRVIIDIYDNGHGLKRENIASFFDIANGTKVDENYVPNGKYGYKGHGSKVFFNADNITICSKTDNGEYWAAELDRPFNQIEKKKKLEYLDTNKPEEYNISIPEQWSSGFRVKITAPKHFNTEITKKRLNHIYLRDYCKWYTVLGTIATLYDEELKNKEFNLHLCGLAFESFKSEYSSFEKCDPVPEIEDTEFGTFEKIPFGHYFPEERKNDEQMKKYLKETGQNTKDFSDFYCSLILNGKEVHTSTGLSFRAVICLEGYETKRRYDLLLSKRGRPKTDLADLFHSDASRYGLWACKGGVPVEKIDDWIVGGKGNYTYMQAFIDCDEFELTANRGSVCNTNIEILETIKKKFNELLNQNRIKDAMHEREEWESIVRVEKTIDRDKTDLDKRYKEAKKKKKIVLPNGIEIFEPSKTKNGYSESETFVVLLTLLQQYPKLFDFKILDYNTTAGIDFVANVSGSPKYIELKGTFVKKMNHPFTLISRFVCYDLSLLNGETLEDFNKTSAKLQINKEDIYKSDDENFNNKKYTSYRIIPEIGQYESIGIIRLKTFLTEVIGATIEETRTEES